ncbi:ImmA/IrrE family metallo-endopeptidase [Wukongibacter sp. M2B1]|uniref:ImmA/IrrE family metallo-endopeptidase n=1 Tax=Wukongibacter sp. M2B1 TaxID=3088895 RepID=UPI003D7B387A
MNVKRGIPRLSKEQIDKRATEFVYSIEKNLPLKPKPVPIEEIIECELQLDLDYKNIDKDKNTLGLTTFDHGFIEVYNKDCDTLQTIEVIKGTIIIESDLVDDERLTGRYRFTCAHEVGHWILHRHLFESDTCLFENSDRDEKNIVRCLNRNIENIFSYYNSKIKTDYDWLEWQADYFAGAILLPIIPFTDEFFRLLMKLHIHQRYLFVDNQRCNIENFKKIIGELSNKFNVSKKAVEVRLAKLNLLRSGN